MRVRGVLLAGAVVAVVAATPAPGGQGADLCGRFGEVAGAGSIAEPRLVEISGLVASRQHADALWTHNDSGGAPEVYALREDGTALGAYPIDGAAATDWEDIAVGPGPDPGASYLYVGDIGDNAAARPSVTVYRVPEPADAPASPGQPLTDVEAIELRYPDGPADAETLLVDPVTGDLVIVTKRFDGTSHVLVAPAASLSAGAPVAMTDVATIEIMAPPPVEGAEPGLPGTAATGGDISPDGSIVLLRTYRSVLAYARTEGQSVSDALRSEPCFAPQAEEPQGEAVAFTGEGSAYVTASEGTGVPVHRASVTPPVPAATTTTATTAPATTTTAPVDFSPLSEDPSATATVLIVLILLGTAAAVIVWARRPRPPSAAG